MDYLSVAEARTLPGLRLVLSAHVPGPWGEAAKAVLKQRNIPFVAVAQTPVEANDDLRAWTGMRNAPIAVYNDEPPRAGWLDILMLAERLGEGPSLLPEDEHCRALCLGISTELCGPDGLGWNRRLGIFASLWRDEADDADIPETVREIRRDYGYTPDSIARAPKRNAAILTLLTDQLQRQKAHGVPYLVGQRLSAADLYWACFSAMFAPLPAEVNPMPDFLRGLYSELDPVTSAALDPILLAHRDMVFEHHIGLPLDY